MAEEEVKQSAVLFAKLAGIRVADERVRGLAAALDTARSIGQALAKHEYGEAEPACQFRAPRGEG